MSNEAAWMLMLIVPLGMLLIGGLVGAGVHEVLLKLNPPAPPVSPTPEETEDDDYAWARERAVNMCASALLDAQVYRQKLLRGFGYPNETFARAQDYRALAILLARLPAPPTTEEK
jgi:hypothetical protein